MNLKEIREAKGLTKYRVAAGLGVTWAQYHLWETGKRRPGRESLIKLADFFGVSTDAILGRTATA